MVSDFALTNVVFTNKRSQAGIYTVYFTTNIWETIMTIVHVCTDEILISYVNSAKNSLTIITHLYFLVYVSRNILH